MRPYFFFKREEPVLPGAADAAPRNNLVAQMWAYAAPYSKRSQAADPWSIYDSENHDAQAESFYLLAAQAFKNRGDYTLRTYQDGSTPAQQYPAWRAPLEQLLRRDREAWSVHRSRVPDVPQLPVGRDPEHLQLRRGPDPAQEGRHGARPRLRRLRANSSSATSGAARRAARTRRSRTRVSSDAMTNYGNLLFGPGPVRTTRTTLALATSGYRTARRSCRSIATNPVRERRVRVRRRGARRRGQTVGTRTRTGTSRRRRSVLNYSWVTPDYVLGTAQLNPADTHIAPSSQNRWQGIIFATGPGDRVYPQAAPSSVTKTMDAFIVGAEPQRAHHAQAGVHGRSRRSCTSRRPSTVVEQAVGCS